MELAPNTVGRQRSVEAARAAAKGLEMARQQLEADRARREQQMKMEREGIDNSSTVLS